MHRDATIPAEAPLSRSIPRLPAAKGFTGSPTGWYLLCESDALKRGPLSLRMLGRDLVAFRTESGRVAVMDGRCAHLGADLGRGDVVGETIRCPFHHWRYGCDGACVGAPLIQEIPAFARQRVYPAEERHGVVFFFNGPKALFPLPFFQGLKPEELVAAKPFSYEADADWLMVASQAFDLAHFQAVHDRRLVAGPFVEQPNPYLRTNRWDAVNIGEEFRDRLLRWLAGPNVSLSIASWVGTMIIVEARFDRAVSRFLVSFHPLEDGRTRFSVLVFAPRGTPRLALRLRRWFTRGHLAAEAATVRHTEYRPAHLTEADADMARCFQWLAELHANAAEKPAS